MDLSYKNLDQTNAYGRLRGVDAKAISLKTLLTADRIGKCSIPAGGGLTFNYAAKKATDEVVDVLQQLADEQQLVAKFEDLYNGAFANVGEKRMVLHHLLRGQLGKVVYHGGKDLGKFYADQLWKIADFCAEVHKGKRKGATGKKFKVAVQIGIGGSDLGPRALYLALEQYARERKLLKMQARFISNVDPDDANAVLAGLNLETTLFILVSKSGTTQETLANEQLVRAKLAAAGLDPSKHMVAVTSETSPLAKSSEYAASFFIDDFIGGRYSSTSAVGGAILSLAFGPKVFKEILAGAHEADALARNPNLRENAAMMDAMIGVWERNFFGYPYTAVLPYCQALVRFPAHLQQLDMESNGKSVTREGKAVKVSTGPVLFGEPGTNGQHAFYQLIHQGTKLVPCDFLAAAEPHNPVADQHAILLANCFAQTEALMKGKTADEAKAELAAAGMAKAEIKELLPHKVFPGNRPTNTLLYRQLTPRTLGRLIALYEHKVFVQGVLWNVNSYDQWGVELGKQLAKVILPEIKADTGTKGHDASTNALIDYCKQWR